MRLETKYIKCNSSPWAPKSKDVENKSNMKYEQQYQRGKKGKPAEYCLHYQCLLKEQSDTL